MNLIPKIAEMLGVEIGEEFKLKWKDCGEFDEIYRLSDRLEYKDKYGYSESCRLRGLLIGAYEIIKLPFEPKKDERYYFVRFFDNGQIEVATTTWEGDFADYSNKCCGNVFRTQEEAEKHKYEVYERLTGKRWELIEETVEETKNS